MNPESFEQVQSDKAGMGGAEKWLKGEEECVVTLWNGTPIQVTPPNFVELKITETDPGVRGDTSGGGGKPATLETGAVENGRASCRERVCPNVSVSVVAVSFKKKPQCNTYSKNTKQ